jgi:hypothetical protein
LEPTARGSNIASNPSCTLRGTELRNLRQEIIDAGHSIEDPLLFEPVPYHRSHHSNLTSPSNSRSPAPPLLRPADQDFIEPDQELNSTSTSTMTTPSMPSRGDRNAPTFDSAKPRELPRHFSDLEYHFTRCNITDDAQKKSHATRFLTVRDQDAWESLTEFTTPTTSYEDFKAAVLKLYPGTDADRKYSLADLDTLVGTHVRTGIHSKGDFSEFYRDFSAISTSIIQKKGVT